MIKVSEEYIFNLDNEYNELINTITKEVDNFNKAILLFANKKLTAPDSSDDDPGYSSDENVAKMSTEKTKETGVGRPGKNSKTNVRENMEEDSLGKDEENKAGGEYDLDVEEVEQSPHATKEARLEKKESELSHGKNKDEGSGHKKESFKNNTTKKKAKPVFRPRRRHRRCIKKFLKKAQEKSTKENKTEEKSTEENKTEEKSTKENKTEENKTDENKTEEKSTKEKQKRKKSKKTNSRLTLYKIPELKFRTKKKNMKKFYKKLIVKLHPDKVGYDNTALFAVYFEECRDAIENKCLYKLWLISKKINLKIKINDNISAALTLEINSLHEYIENLKNSEMYKWIFSRDDRCILKYIKKNISKLI